MYLLERAHQRNTEHVSDEDYVTQLLESCLLRPVTLSVETMQWAIIKESWLTGIFLTMERNFLNLLSNSAILFGPLI